jgi:pimeloyl-ACP methyl ester carboxylesterase
MRAARPRRLGASLVAGGLLALAPAAVASPLKRCDLEHPTRSLCGHVTVPLDRTGAVPGVVRLRVRMLPAHTGEASETIVALAGGPGQAAAPLLGTFAASLGETLRSRRLVVFDQRGTGRSGRLRCPSLAGVPSETTPGTGEAIQAAVASCAARLGPARAHYATADSVADLEAVRVALGLDNLILYGTSYGTKVALDYAAAHPEHVSRLVLDSVVPPGGTDPFVRTTLGSIPRVLRAVCGRRCPFTRDPGADVAALARRLAREPLAGPFVNRRGRVRRERLDRRELFALLLEGDVNPFRRLGLPAAVRSALAGDPAPILRMAVVREATGLDADHDSEASFLATTCADGGVPWPTGTPIEAREAAVGAALAAVPAEQLAPFGRDGVRELGFADLCRAWPESPVAQPVPALPAVPTLIFSGDQDLRTPRADALALARRLPDAQVVTVPDGGHGALGYGCSARALRAFLVGRAPRPCRAPRDGPFLEFFQPSGLAPMSLRTLRPAPSLPPHVGRTVTAVYETVLAFGRQLSAELPASVLESDDFDLDALRFGGLRGGRAVFGEIGLLMRRYSYVPGVALSIRIPLREDAGSVLLRVRGSAAARGLLRIGGRWTRGKLGGHRFRMRNKRLFPEAESAAAARAASLGAGTPPLPAPLHELLGRLRTPAPRASK